MGILFGRFLLLASVCLAVSIGQIRSGVVCSDLGARTLLTGEVSVDFHIPQVSNEVKMSPEENKRWYHKMAGQCNLSLSIYISFEGGTAWGGGSNG